MSKILCQEERTNEAVFGALLGMADNLTGRKLSDLDEKEKPAPRVKVEKPPSTMPPKTVKAKRADLHRGDNNDFPPSDKPHATRAKGGAGGAAGQLIRHRKPAPSAAEIRAEFYIGQRLRDLSPEERKDLRRKLDALLKKRAVKIFLVVVERGEGGDLLMIVGGKRGKSKDCRDRIDRLDATAHPKEQGLPNRCFLRTRYGLSTAAGKYQIVYYRNWRHLRRLLDLKDFSANSQGIAALELVRSSRVTGGKIGEGLVALVQNDLERAVRKGTDPWACSPYSRWSGKNPAPLLQYARQERKKKGDDKYDKRQAEALKRRADNS